MSGNKPVKCWENEEDTGGQAEVIEDLHAAVELHRAEIETLRAVLAHYSKGYCEGWCALDDRHFEDCGGCPARKALNGGDDDH